MERSMKPLFLVLTLLFSLSPAYGFAASPSATSSPDATATPSVNEIETLTPKSEPSKKVVPTKKATPKKKPSAPSPPAKWPPKGFKVRDGVHWRTPSVETMMNVAADNAALARSIKACKEFSCGRIQVASFDGCEYWEIESRVVTPNPDAAGSFLTMGMLRTLVKSTIGREIATVVLRSGVAYSPTVAVVPTGIVCHQNQTTERVPNNIYSGR